MNRIYLIGIWLLCMLASFVAGIRMMFAIVVSPRRAWRLAVAHDQLANAAANGSEDETISSRANRARLQGKRWGCVLCKLLDKFDKGHCEKSAGY